jgi:hypothetical protein
MAYNDDGNLKLGDVVVGGDGRRDEMGDRRRGY